VVRTVSFALFSLSRYSLHLVCVFSSFTINTSGQPGEQRWRREWPSSDIHPNRPVEQCHCCWWWRWCVDRYSPGVMTVSINYRLKCHLIRQWRPSKFLVCRTWLSRRGLVCSTNALKSGPRWLRLPGRHWYGEGIIGEGDLLWLAIIPDTEWRIGWRWFSGDFVTKRCQKIFLLRTSDSVYAREQMNGHDGGDAQAPRRALPRTAFGDAKYRVTNWRRDPVLPKVGTYALVTWTRRPHALHLRFSVWFFNIRSGGVHPNRDYSDVSARDNSYAAGLPRVTDLTPEDWAVFIDKACPQWLQLLHCRCLRTGVLCANQDDSSVCAIHS